MSISIDMIKQLRDATLAPLGDCKEALVEANGDLELAKEILKKKGAIKADKKADRETNNGIVRFVVSDDTVVGIKLLCETDFVAKNEAFGALVDSLVSATAQYAGDVDPEQVPADLMDTLQTLVKDQAVTIGEAMKIAYVYKTKAHAYAYNHGGSLSSVVFYDGSDDEVAKTVALQVAAMNPLFVSIDDVPTDRIAQLKSEFAADESLSNKPENIRDQIVEGKVQKAVQDDILLEQASIKDQSKKIKELLPAGFVVKSFLRVSI